MKRALWLAVGLVVAAACGGDDSGEIQSLLWDTSGGGDLHFSVVRTAPDYQIVVTARQGPVSNVTFLLTAGDGTAYRLVDDIFAGRRNVREFVVTPRGPTGTWTTITLTYADGHRDTVNDISATGELGGLYGFVDSHFPSRLSPPAAP
jgi:hypothetical protein